MIDNSTIDSHKLAYHPDRVNQWLATGDTTPIYIEVSPSIRCNLKCRFCAYGSADRKVDIKSEYLLWAAYRDNILPYMKELGIKSVMYGGEGEPTLNKYLADMIMGTTSLGIDTALTTNGTTLWEHRIDLSYLTWVKVSLDAGNSTTYEIVKGADMYQDVVEQIAAVCAIEKAHRSWGDIPCTIGFSSYLRTTRR
jgi:cyclic pyranopterin phosphate synthase